MKFPAKSGTTAWGSTAGGQHNQALREKKAFKWSWWKHTPAAPSINDPSRLVRRYEVAQDEDTQPEQKEVFGIVARKRMAAQISESPGKHSPPPAARIPNVPTIDITETTDDADEELLAITQRFKGPGQFVGFIGRCGKSARPAFSARSAESSPIVLLASKRIVEEVIGLVVDALLVAS
ncbi:hypothetical protein CDD82_2526 [Ophiocordyceps australis]|uniref:Uncharacterized protein n=1 Tax=Ophiocordyceps australis TaxID=1399860 RepID=A0A2C5YMB2_9HYPO|nr:hypothetical protein CDD82_2526 [Ophiocordyceps australis]